MRVAAGLVVAVLLLVSGVVVLAAQTLDDERDPKRAQYSVPPEREAGLAMRARSEADQESRRIELARERFRMFAENSPREAREFSVSLRPAIPALSLLQTARREELQLDRVFVWLDPGPKALDVVTGEHLLRFLGDDPDSVVERLRETYRRTIERWGRRDIEVSPDHAVPLYGFTCTCTPDALTTLEGAVSSKFLAIEHVEEGDLRPIWPRDPARERALQSEEESAA